MRCTAWTDSDAAITVWLPSSKIWLNNPSRSKIHNLSCTGKNKLLRRSTIRRRKKLEVNKVWTVLTKFHHSRFRNWSVDNIGQTETDNWIAIKQKNKTNAARRDGLNLVPGPAATQVITTEYGQVQSWWMSWVGLVKAQTWERSTRSIYTCTSPSQCCSQLRSGPVRDAFDEYPHKHNTTLVSLKKHDALMFGNKIEICKSADERVVCRMQEMRKMVFFFFLKRQQK